MVLETAGGALGGALGGGAGHIGPFWSEGNRGVDKCVCGGGGANVIHFLYMYKVLGKISVKREPF